MREIKFRAMTKNNNTMVFGDLIVCPNREHRILWFDKKGEMPLDVDYDSFNEIVQSSTIGQFIGQHIKNDCDIYEGDILKNTKGEIGEVVFRDGGFNLECRRKNGSIWYIPLTISFLSNKKVIGNIYENPELLNQKQ